MPKTPRQILIILAAAAGIFAAATSARASTDLAVLKYRQGDSFKSTSISAKAGSYSSPEAGSAEASWIIDQGDTIKAGTQPPDREIHFYGVVNGSRTLLCTVAVSYAWDGSKWQPGYRLETHAVAFVYGGQQVAVRRNDGYQGVVQLPGANFPNLSGYYNSLEFGIPYNPITIDSWTVN